MVNDTRAHFGHTEKKACSLIGISRSSYHYIPQLPCDDTIKERMRDLAYKKPRYGVRRLHAILKKEGLVVNHKRTERIYKQEGLAIRIKTKKKLPPSVRLTLCVPARINQQWAIDFVHDNTGSGRRFRCLLSSRCLFPGMSCYSYRHIHIRQDSNRYSSEVRRDTRCPRGYHNR